MDENKVIVSFNLTKLSASKLSPNEFVICYLLLKKEFNLLKGCLSWIDSKELISVLRNLEAKRYVKIGYEKIEESIDFEKIFVRQPFIEIMQLDITGTPFEELREIYPKKTSGGRRLHTNLILAKKKYLEFLRGNAQLHPLILKAVELEVKERTLHNKLDFMQNLATYIHQKSWDAYMEDVLKYQENPNYNVDEQAQRSRVL